MTNDLSEYRPVPQETGFVCRRCGERILNYTVGGAMLPYYVTPAGAFHEQCVRSSTPAIDRQEKWKIAFHAYHNPPDLGDPEKTALLRRALKAEKDAASSDCLMAAAMDDLGYTRQKAVELLEKYHALLGAAKKVLRSSMRASHDRSGYMVGVDEEAWKALGALIEKEDTP